MVGSLGFGSVTQEVNKRISCETLKGLEHSRLAAGLRGLECSASEHQTPPPLPYVRTATLEREREREPETLSICRESETDTLTINTIPYIPLYI